MAPSQVAITAGAAAMATFGLISLTVSTIMLRTLLKMRFHSAPFNQFVLCLCIADICQSAATNVNWIWLGIGGTQQNGFCSFQGFMFNFGNVSSSFWSFVIAAVTWARVVHQLQFRQAYVWASCGFCYGLPLLLTCLGFALEETPPFFSPQVGVWCWINAYYPNARISLHYGWIFAVAFGMIPIYAHLGWYVYRYTGRNSVQGALSRRDIVRIMSQMAMYPLCYFTVFVPLGLARLIAAGGGVVSFDYTITAVCIFVCNGTVNGVIFWRALARSQASRAERQPAGSSLSRTPVSLSTQSTPHTVDRGEQL